MRGMFWKVWRRLGYRPDPFVHPVLHEAFRAEPLVVYDVGAAGQLFAFAPVDDHRQRIVGFEPTPSSYRSLVERYGRSTQVDLHELALADRTGEATFHIPVGRPTTSTLRHEVALDGSGQRPEVEEIVVALETLDEHLADASRPTPDFLKLDTEGSELDLLHGGERTVARDVMGVLVEVLLTPLGGQGVELHELQGFLSRSGFVLFDIKQSRVNRSGRTIGAKKGPIDSLYLLYVRDYYRWYAEIGEGNRALARRKLLATMAISMGYLYLDHIVELADFGRTKELLTGEEAAAVLGAVGGVQDISWRVPAFPGRTALANAADFVSYLLHPDAKHAAPPMHNNLGNRRSAIVRRTVPPVVRLVYPIRSRTDSSAATLDVETDQSTSRS